MPRATLRPWLPVLLLGACSAPVAPPVVVEAPPRKLLTLEQTMGQGEPVDFTGKLPRFTWAPDGVHLVRDGEGGKVWLDPDTGVETPAPAEPPREPRDDGVAAALVAAGVPEEQAKGAAAHPLARPANGGALLDLSGDLWWVQAGAARRLASAADGAPELPEPSPDGAHVAFVQANDLVLVSTADGARREVTQDGSRDVFNGILDWVYQEELYGRGDWKAFWWSPDSRHVAFLRLDETLVQDFTVIDHIEAGHFRVKPEVTRYPKVGDPNPVAALGVVDAAGAGPVRWADLSAYAAEEPLVVRVGWTPGGERLLYMVQDRIQTWLDLLAADPATLAPQLLLRETSKGWVNRPEPPHWLVDGSFLWLSERSGQRHVERRAADGALLAEITAGDWSVREVEHVDEAAGLLWFTATRDGAVDRHGYRTGLDGHGLVRLTQHAGQHALTWNPARTQFLDRCSSLAQPPRLRLCDADGRVLRELGAAQAPDLQAYATSRWELHQVPARDGFPLDVALLKPVGFDPARRYPVWLPTYSGPDAPSVNNAWNGGAWHQFLAQNGVIVLQVNVRTASGRGQAVTEGASLQLGVPELRDLEDAVDWVCAQHGGDPARVGITGVSYGGFMAAFALTHSDRFAAAIAASGVYDWRMYDTIYTERYMSTPARNPDGYARTSVLAAAADLRGHLVLTHGEMDDNVHLQNAVQLVWALQKAGKDFEFVLYPQSRHGISDGDLRWWDRRLAWRVIREELLGAE
jgi:dipeptidyl-peptidase-4